MAAGYSSCVCEPSPPPFDFPKGDSLQVQAVLQMTARVMQGEVPANTYRSFGDSRDLKRKACHIEFQSEASMRDDAKLLELVKAEMEGQGLGHVLVGWDHSFALPEDTFILAFDDLSWSADGGVNKFFCECILVSRSKATIKIPSAYPNPYCPLRCGA